LYATGSAIHTYLWTGPNGFTSSLQNPVLTKTSVASNGNYSVKVNAGNCTVSSSVFVSGIDAKPIAARLISPNTVCEGSTAQLTTDTYSGYTVSYIWHTPNGDITTPSAELLISTISMIDKGYYNLTVEVNGCSSAKSNSIYLNVENIPTVTLASNGPICEGNRLTLSATPTVAGLYSYSWISPSNTVFNRQNLSINNISANDAGLYELSIMSANKLCSKTEYLQVDVLSKPQKPVIVSNTSICAGETINLSVSVGAAKYYWTMQNGALITTTDGKLDILTGNANYINGFVKVTAEDASGCISENSDNFGIEINPIPIAPLVYNNGPICSGNKLLLTASTIEGVVYNWTGPGGFVSGQQNPEINGALTTHSGAYTLTVKAKGCNSAPSQTTVLVNATPTTPLPAANSPICQGNNLVLSANTVAAEYLWTGPNSFSSNEANPTILYVNKSNEGTYQLTVYENGCPSKTSSLIVNVLGSTATPIIANNGPVCEDQKIVLTTQSYTGKAVNYNWFGPSGFVGNSTVPTFIINNSDKTDAGAYSVVVDVDGCSSLSSGYTFVTVNSIPVNPIIVSNSPACEGGVLSIWTETLVDEYYWIGPNGFTSNLQYPPAIQNINTNHAGNYTLVLVNKGCAMVDTTTEIKVSQKPLKPLLITNSPVCVGNNLELSTLSAAESYIWTTPLGISYTTLVPNYTITPAQVSHGGEYSLEIVSNGCTSVSSDIQKVIINTASAELAYAGDDFIVCGNEKDVYLESKNTLNTGYWTTNSDAKIISPYTSKTIINNLVKGNDYVFKWILSNGACANVSEDSVTVRVPVAPIANYDYYEVKESSFNNILRISVNDSTWRYDFTAQINLPAKNGNLTVNSDQSITYNPFIKYVGTDKFLYEICLEECANLCDTAWVEIKVSADIFVNDIITPNGDGVNDNLVINGLENYPENEISVFNRWGNRIYTAENYRNEWDGTFKGEPVPAGTYFFVFKDRTTGKLVAKGYLTIHR